MRTASSGSGGQLSRAAAPGVSWPTSCASARTGATRRANFVLRRRDGSCRNSPRSSGLPCRRRGNACRRRRRPGIFRTCRFAAVWRRRSRWNRFRGVPTRSGGAMETHHPQRWTRPPGAQRCYWIASSRHGRLGGLLRRQLAPESARRVRRLVGGLAGRQPATDGQQQPVSPVAGGARARACVARSRPRGDATARRLGSRLRRASGLHLRLSRPAPAIVRQGGSVAASRHRGCRRAPGGGASRGR